MPINPTFASFKRFIAPSVESQPGDFFYLLLLAFCFGAYFLLLTVAIYMPGGVVESEEFLIYLQGWVTVPLLTWLAVLGVRGYQQRFFADDPNFYPVFAAVCALTTLFSGAALSLSWRAFKSLPLSFGLVIFTILFYPAIQVFALALIRKYRRWLAYRARPGHLRFLKWAALVAAGLFLINFCGIFASGSNIRDALWPVLLAVLGGALAHFLSSFINLPVPRRLTVVFDIVALILICLACFDPKFTVETLSQNFFLGPVNALLHGRTMLVDVYSQYGVFLLEFLAAIFWVGHFPLTYQFFSLIVALLGMLQFGLIYGMLRVMFKSAGYALLGLCLALLLNFFATLGIFQSYPSIGPLRFGLCYLLVSLILLRLKFPRFGRLLIGLEAALFGLASIWSFETFVYVAAVFVGSRVYQTLLEKLSFRKFAARLLAWLSWGLLSILIFQAAQALYIFSRAGQWPQWGIYLNYLFKYSAGGFGTLPIDPWSPWFFLAISYFICILSVGLRWSAGRGLDGSPENQTLLNLSLMGIAQFTYFVGRSSSNNLFHICLPALIIALSGFQRVRQLKGEEFRAARLLFYVSMVFLALVFFPSFIKKLPDTAFPTVRSWIKAGINAPAQIQAFADLENQSLTVGQSKAPQTLDAVYLIQKYAPQQPRVVVLISAVKTTEAVILSKKAQLYPMNDPLEDSLSPQIVQFILDSPNLLRPGDMIFLASDPRLLSLQKVNVECTRWTGTPNQCIEIQQKVVAQICGRFGFDEIEKSPNGVSAMRLTTLGGGSSDYCHRLNSYLGLQDN